ncbi:Synaptonemal complex protein 1 [Glycine max]|nr:Synaptonemal complex protein 1 [Glycine max]
MKQEHDKRQASLIAEHNEQLKRTQLQAENELREKTMFMRNDHEAQIKALRCELEDECRKLEEELHLQKIQNRQRALLQLQWKVMSDKPKEDQEVNSKQVDLCFNLFVCVCLQMDAIFANFHVGIPLVVWFDILHLSFGRHSWENEKTFLKGKGEDSALKASCHSSRNSSIKGGGHPHPSKGSLNPYAEDLYAFD